MRRSLSDDNGTSELRSSGHVVADDVTGGHVTDGYVTGSRCGGWTARGAGQCAHLLVPLGFAVTIMWICVLWIVVRVLRRRRPAAVVDASYSTSSLCYCRRGLGRRDVLAWTAPQRPPTGKDHVGAAPGEAVVVNDAPHSALLQARKYLQRLGRTKISYDSLAIMPTLRSTYDGRLIYRT